jgi:arylsulfatase A-like enzyme
VRPNILIFMTDQEQADVVHPSHPCITPNATALARDGLLFRRSYMAPTLPVRPMATKTIPTTPWFVPR